MFREWAKMNQERQILKRKGQHERLGCLFIQLLFSFKKLILIDHFGTTADATAVTPAAISRHLLVAFLISCLIILCSCGFFGRLFCPRCDPSVSLFLW